MSIQITGKNIDVGDAFRDYVTGRVAQVVGKYVGSELSGHILVEKERNHFRTNCSIQLRSGLTLQSQGESGDAYASADVAFDRLEKRLRRHKRKLKNHHQALPPGNGMHAADYVVQPGEDEEDHLSDNAPMIIAETRIAIRELRVSDAVMEMDLSEQSFLVFRNAAHGGVNIVYKREDGNIGWIDPANTTAS